MKKQKYSDILNRIVFRSGRLLLAATIVWTVAVPVQSQISALQSEEDAVISDNALVAEANGWTYEQAAAHSRAAEVVGAAAEKIAERYPKQFVGSALSKKPGGTPSLYIKGKATPEIQSLMRSASSKSNVGANATVAIRLVDNQPYSFGELEKRKSAVHASMVQAGFDQVATGFRLEEQGMVRAGVTTKMRYGRGSKAAVVRLDEYSARSMAFSAMANLPAELRDSVILDVSDQDTVVDEHAYGGTYMQLLVPVGTIVDGVAPGFRTANCTTGWTVELPLSTLDIGVGVTTAGHCDNGYRRAFTPPPDGLGGVVAGNLVFQREHEGQYGDIQWHSTPFHLDPAEFYYKALDRRQTLAVEQIENISQGESACLYSPRTGERTCAFVEQVSVACSGEDRLVMMDRDIGQRGDSGGGWSWFNTAFGSHKGNCSLNGNDVFSAAAFFPQAIGMKVFTQ